MKINITMNDELLERVDQYAKENYTTRSGLISLACVQYLNQQEAINAVRLMSNALQRIAATGTIDEDAQQKLNEFAQIAKLLGMQ